MNNFNHISIDFVIGERDGLYAEVDFDGAKITGFGYPTNGGSFRFDEEDRDWANEVGEKLVTIANKRIAKNDICLDNEENFVVAELTKKFRVKGSNYWVPVTATILASRFEEDGEDE